MNNTRRLTEGAVLLAIFAVLLLITIFVPFIGTISIWFLPLPFIYFAWKNDVKNITVFLIASFFITLIVGTIKAIPLAFLFGLTGVTLGYFVQKRKSRIVTLMAGSMAFLISLIIIYGAAVILFKINFLADSMDLLKKSLDTSFQLLESMGKEKDAEKLKSQVELMLNMFDLLLPSLLVMSSFTLVFFLQLIHFPILKRFGLNPVKWTPFRNLSLPRSILWYYIITIILSILLKPEEGSYVYLAIWNVAFILQRLLVLQGLSLVYFVSHLKGWPLVIPIVVTVITLIQPLILYIIMILGIIDLGFEFRKRIFKK
ncbi:YybS family protein [Bacillus sp. CGMCC 1.16607]|uniref:YybS family protein n=1 Tax=Bacillus sp. CGMCC 1.16607 TaxID=3351842 RepID=UPI00363C68DB